MNMQTRDLGLSALTECLFMTGFGQSDTHAVHLNDGRANPHKAAGTPYGGISESQVVAMVKAPQSCPKERAQWIIGSDYRQSDGRGDSAQCGHGQFWFLSLDVDQNNLALAEVRACVLRVTGQCRVLLYSTASATPDNRKWRVFVSLQEAIAGGDYQDTTRACFDLLEGASEGVLIPDRALQSPGQLIYLPNKRGDFYEHHIGEGPPLALTPDHPIIRRREATRATLQQVEREAQSRQARRKASQPVGSGMTPVEAFNVAHSVADLLARYGYAQAGQSNDWRSLYQTSGSHATRDCGAYWVSLSDSDAAQNLGAALQNGKRYGDAFDLFCHFDHGGDFNKAVAAYSHEAGLKKAVKPATAKPSVVKPATDFDIIESELGDDFHRFAGDQNEEFDLGEAEVTEDGIARAFTALHGDTLLFDHDAGRWYQWTGDHWKAEATGRAYHFAREIARNASDWMQFKARDKVRRSAFAAGVERFARSDPAHAVTQEVWDADPMLLGCIGVTVDLRTGFARAPHPRDRMTRQTTVTPAEAPACPLWLGFLKDATGGDQSMVKFLQQWCGYSLTGSTKEHALIFLYGPGGNGKSVFLNTIAGIMGSYAVTASMDTFTASKGDKHPTDLAMLRGARLVSASETEEGRAWAESRIK